MKGGSDIISAFDHLKQASDHFNSFSLECGEKSKGEKLSNGYKSRIEWIFKDIITNPLLPELVREGVKREWNCDVFTPDAIREKVALLNPVQRDNIEILLDMILSGQKLNVELKKETN